MSDLSGRRKTIAKISCDRCGCLRVFTFLWRRLHLFRLSRTKLVLVQWDQLILIFLTLQIILTCIALSSALIIDSGIDIFLRAASAEDRFETIFDLLLNWCLFLGSILLVGFFLFIILAWWLLEVLQENS